MKITQQSNQNECGVCVINSLLHHFYRFDNKQKVLDVCKLSANGLSLFEFENTCVQFNLSALSYQLTFNEFKNLKINGYFVLLISRLGSNHFVIAKKNKNGVEIYDSALGKYQLSYQELSKVFLGILIKVKKLKKLKLNFSSNKFNFQLNPIVLMVSLLLQGISAVLSIGFGFFINAVIDLTINNEAFKTLIFLTFMFLIISLLKNTTHYLLERFNLHYCYDYYSLIKHKLLQNILNKKSSFFLKVEPNYFYMINHVMYEISGFYINTISSFINSVLVTLVISIVVSVLNPSFLIVVGINLLLEIFFNWIIFHHQENFYDQSLIKTNDSNKVCQQFINYQKQTINCLNYDYLSNQINKAFNNNTYLQNKQLIFNSKLSWVQGLLADLIYLGTIFIGTILIQKLTGITIGEMLFFASTIIYFNSHIAELVGFYLKVMMNNKLTKIYLDYLLVDNLETKFKQINKKIKSIKILNNGKKTELKKIKENYQFYCNLMSNKITSQETKVLINNIDCLEIHSNWINNHLCYLNQFNHVFIDEINQEIISNNQINPKLLKIATHYEQENIKNLIYALMYLTTKENLIIICDQILKVFNKEDYQFLKQEIIPYLAKKHYLVIN
ncbi:MAG: cysteine peptidase family C39 domain-containing protein [Mycoplasma sp.]